MAHPIRYALPAVVLGSIAACSGAGEDPLASGQQGLSRTIGVAEGAEPTTRPPRDSGVVDTAKSPLITAAPVATVFEGASSSAPCAPARYDIHLASGRKCWDLAKSTATGTWSVTPLFSDAPAAIRDTACAATWLPKSPTCAAPDLAALALTCPETKSMAARTAACAADPAACAVTTEAKNLGTSEPPRPPASCEPIIIDGGIPGGYAGGCDSCGIINGGLLYLTNPYGKPSIFTNLSTPTGVQQINVAIPPSTSSAVSMPGYPDGPIYIWPGF